jgi:hypothetical protein
MDDELKKMPDDLKIMWKEVLVAWSEKLFLSMTKGTDADGRFHWLSGLRPRYLCNI